MQQARATSATVIIPARNEEGHIERIFQEMPHFSEQMELIFVEGNSTDNTWKELQQCARLHAEKWPNVTLLQQKGHGKADAVWEGIAHATGDIIFILDADLTVPPASLPKFYTPFTDGSATFTFGSRLVYPMEKGAMRFWNLIANKIFAFLWCPFFHRKITDSLCGTKVFLRKDYERTRKEHPRIFAADPFGDFALFFIAPSCHCSVKEIPIHYRARQYGVTNIARWKGGVQLLWVYFLCLLALLKAEKCSNKQPTP
ncbi:MAG TPA: glycosyltransferase family 2 protein [Candidatus Peribacteraceae bacterium]|nr:glycosyltransferase family 2 protein [Candidatus Peribacteraceae bacterium]